MLFKVTTFFLRLMPIIVSLTSAKYNLTIYLRIEKLKGMCPSKETVALREPVAIKSLVF